MKLKFQLFLPVFSLLVLSSCSTKYVTPGGDVKISELADEDISKVLSNKPTAEFPVTIAVARIQAPRYSNYRYSQNENQASNGNFTMILTRDANEEKQIQEIGKLQGIKQISPFNRLLLPYNYPKNDKRFAFGSRKNESTNALSLYF